MVYCAAKVIENVTSFYKATDHDHDQWAPTQSVCVADCYFIVNVLDLPFALPIAIYR